ncbi:PAS domain-containing protein [Flavobacterium sp. LS1R49]|uniref:PAS domain-containing protein n=1 Tax=Flavobacterium shii TaxID=2987687 RepID=A0A9X3C5T4_9FLAO|nr:PAS domain-containing protein [Flavobacterium shii]MCV9928017.1 PAS domain-containing protein [Flavobacterium shii]
MYNLDAYDEAIAKYHEGLKHTCVPIISWDFHQQHLNDIKSNFSDFDSVKKIAKHFNWDDSEFDVLERLKEEVVVITDLELNIIFASNRILNMTGYTEIEILGKTPKIFQGPETSTIVTSEIRLAIKAEESFEKTILNYKKNGDTYFCTVNAFPVFNLKGKLSHFIAFEKAA